jgi:DNA-directed RNA polymerase subunit omega
MARVTVEDCVENVVNRFQLVLIAANRAKQLSRGGVPTVDRYQDKNPVLALREIAVNKVRASELEENLLATLQGRRPSNGLDLVEQDCEGDQDWSEQIALLSQEIESLSSGNALPEDEEGDLDFSDEAEELDVNVSDDLDEDLKD